MRTPTREKLFAHHGDFMLSLSPNSPKRAAELMPETGGLHHHA